MASHNPSVHIMSVNPSATKLITASTGTRSFNQRVQTSSEVLPAKGRLNVIKHNQLANPQARIDTFNSSFSFDSNFPRFNQIFPWLTSSFPCLKDTNKVTIDFSLVTWQTYIIDWIHVLIFFCQALTPQLSGVCGQQIEYKGLSISKHSKCVQMLNKLQSVGQTMLETL